MLGKELISVINTETEEEQKESAKRVLKRVREILIQAEKHADQVKTEYNRLINLPVSELAEREKNVPGNYLSLRNDAQGYPVFPNK